MCLFACWVVCFALDSTVCCDEFVIHGHQVCDFEFNYLDFEYIHNLLMKNLFRMGVVMFEVRNIIII